MKTFKSLSHCKCSCKYHIVWCPKYRRKVLINGIDIRLKTLLIEKSKELEIEIIEMEIMSDHVHLLAEIPPVIEVGRIIGRLKGYTSHYLRKEFPELTRKLPCLWTNSYFVSTVGGAPLEIVKQYIEE